MFEKFFSRTFVAKNRKIEQKTGKFFFITFFELFQVRFPSPPLTLFAIFAQRKSWDVPVPLLRLFFLKNLETLNSFWEYTEIPCKIFVYSYMCNIRGLMQYNRL